MAGAGVLCFVDALSGDAEESGEELRAQLLLPAAIWPESDCCVICRAAAARVKLRSRARTEKYSIVCRFMVFPLSQVLPVSYARIYSFTM